MHELILGGKERIRSVALMSGAEGFDDAGMDYPLCERCGLDPNTIRDRIRVLGLDQPDAALRGQELQQNVVATNVDRIVDSFYGSLAGTQEFDRVAEDPAMFSRLRVQHQSYLIGLGIGFREQEYFEERLRIGAAHQRAGVPQGLYQCAYQTLQGLLIDFIPDALRKDEAAFHTLLRFILRITALDMSLAADSYCVAKVSDLTATLRSERDKSEQLRKLAVTDWLTGLHNHSFARRSLEGLLKQRGAADRAFCVIMADLDHFKAINDLYGHLVGDEVLKICAARMVAGARAGDKVCRYGGEEFLLILEGAGLVEAQEAAERVRSRIAANAVHCGDEQINLSISLGLAEAHAGDTANSLIERADAALYAAKGAGRNCIRS